MRIFIRHHTDYHYDVSPKSIIQLLRMTPRHHDGQYVVRWRIDLLQDSRLDQREDAFGNLVHAFTLAGPFDRIGVHIEGEVETQISPVSCAERWSAFRPACFCDRPS